jgi:Putative restriction endonuclease
MPYAQGSPIYYFLVRREVASQKGLSSGAAAIAIGSRLGIEILSPTNTRRDLDQKLEDYRSIGVRECWIVSSEALTGYAVVG